MAAATICSDFEALENKVCHCFNCFPIYLPRTKVIWEINKGIEISATYHFLIKFSLNLNDAAWIPPLSFIILKCLDIFFPKAEYLTAKGAQWKGIPPNRDTEVSLERVLKSSSLRKVIHQKRSAIREKDYLRGTEYVTFYRCNL